VALWLISFVSEDKKRLVAEFRVMVIGRIESRGEMVILDDPPQQLLIEIDADTRQYARWQGHFAPVIDQRLCPSPPRDGDGQNEDCGLWIAD
jgi:hypothetical protein